jgi:hypothetical protein
MRECPVFRVGARRIPPEGVARSFVPLIFHLNHLAGADQARPK